MQNLESLLQQIQAHTDGMTFEQYLEVVGPVIPSQTLFKLESCEGDTGFLLRSDDGSYHIWFVGKTTSPRYEGFRFHVTETSTWAPNQLSEAMNSLMLQMQTDCEWLIDRDGERYQKDDDGIPL